MGWGKQQNENIKAAATGGTFGTIYRDPYLECIHCVSMWGSGGEGLSLRMQPPFFTFKFLLIDFIISNPRSSP